MATELQVERAALRARIPSNGKIDVSTRPRSHSNLDAFSPVNTDGCFEFDRVIKSGYVEKRTQKTKVRMTLGPRMISGSDYHVAEMEVRIHRAPTEYPFHV